MSSGLHAISTLPLARPRSCHDAYNHPDPPCDRLDSACNFFQATYRLKTFHLHSYIVIMIRRKSHFCCPMTGLKLGYFWSSAVSLSRSYSSKTLCLRTNRYTTKLYIYARSSTEAVLNTTGDVLKLRGTGLVIGVPRRRRRVGLIRPAEF